eukprot:g993.t1
MKHVEQVQQLTDSDASVPANNVAPVNFRDISDVLIQSTVNAMPVQPDHITVEEGPVFELSRVDSNTADVKIIHGFRAHFRPNKVSSPRPECFEHSLKDASEEKIKNRVHRRGSLSILSSDSGKNLFSRDCGCPWEIDPADITLGKRIAVGGFAEVFTANYQGSTVAVKRYFDQDSTAIEQFRHEVSLLARLRHPNLILFMGYCRTPELSIIYEFMPRGSLFDILRSNDGTPLDDPHIEIVLVSVARGMNYLHTRLPPILHLDLKSPNILIDHAWRVKITDFGVSQLRSRTLVSGNHGSEGTPHWMAPEAMRSEKVNESTDVFSFGVIIWELLTGRVPWHDLHAIQVIARVGFQNQSLPRPDHPDRVLVDLMESCLDHDPSKRPRFSEIITILDDHYIDNDQPKLPKLELGDTNGLMMMTNEDQSVSTPIGTLVEIPDSLSSVRFSHTTEESITRSLDQVGIFDGATKAQMDQPISDKRPRVSPFGQVASSPLDPEAIFGRQNELERSQSLGETTTNQDAELARKTDHVSPFAAFASDPFLVGSRSQSFSQSLQERSSQIPEQNEASILTTRSLESSQSNLQNQLSQKRQLSDLYKVDSTIQTQVPEEEFGPHGESSNSQRAAASRSSHDTNFFHLDESHELHEWSIKVADEDVLKSQGSPGLVSSELPDTDENPITTVSDEVKTASADLEEMEDWNLNEESEDPDTTETSSSSIVKTQRRNGLIPPMSFICRGTLPHHD